jgi:hypothetical protein
VRERVIPAPSRLAEEESSFVVAVRVSEDGGAPRHSEALRASSIFRAKSRKMLKIARGFAILSTGLHGPSQPTVRRS